MKLSPIAILVAICVSLAALAVWAMPQVEPRWGVTFSTKYSRELGLNPETVFWEVVNDLNVRAIRLPVYWDEVNPQFDVWNWQPYDHLVEMADEKGVALTLAVGMKTPRWPECHVPEWAASISSIDSFDKQRSAYIDAVIKRYDGHVSVERYQIENEPLFPFGECPGSSIERLEEEVHRARLVTTKPIQITASGEFELWSRVAPLVDVLGVSLYRISWNDAYGFFRYPIPAAYYRLRAMGIQRPVIISELQAEPWFPVSIESHPASYWAQLFTSNDFRDQVRFARRTGLSEAYLWGVEWWYYLRAHGYPELWDAARPLWR